MIALGIVVAAFGLYVFRPSLGNSQFAHVAVFIVLLAVGIGLPTMLLLALGYLAGALWARLEERRAPQRPRPEQVLETLRSSERELAIHGSSFLWLGVLLMLGGIALLLGSKSEPIVSAGAIALIAMAAALGFAALPSLGKPKLVLSRRGFRSPHTPFIPWSEVQGVHLRALNHKGVMNYALMFRIESLPRRIYEFSAFHRMRHVLRRRAGKETFWVPLRSTSYPPEQIYEWARHLWTQATGRDHDWNPDMSERYNAAQRDRNDPANQRIVVEELRAKTRKLMLAGAASVILIAAYAALRLLG